MKKTLLFFIVGLLFVGKLFAGGTLFIDDEAGVHKFLAFPGGSMTGLERSDSSKPQPIVFPSRPLGHVGDYKIGAAYFSCLISDEEEQTSEICRTYQEFDLDPTLTYVLKFKEVKGKIQMQLSPFESMDTGEGG